MGNSSYAKGMESHLDRFRVRLTPSNTNPNSPDASKDSSSTTGLDTLPTGRIISCDRCRQFKKKCSKTLPECTTCVNAGIKCSLATASTTIVTDLRSRVSWMENFINERRLLRGGKRMEQITTGSDLSGLVDETDKPRHTNASPSTSTASLTSTIASPGTQYLRRVMGPQTPEDGNDISQRPPKRARLEAVTPKDRHPNDIPSPAAPMRAGNVECRTFVDAYFRDVNRAYPFVDRARVLSTLDSKGASVLSASERDADETTVFLVMAIGYTTLQRAGRVPTDSETDFQVEYKDILAGFLVEESTDTVQILLLLAIYSQFDPRGFSTRPIVDMLARQAIRLGLTRRATADDGLSPAVAERNHRLFWSIYALDRMIAASAGMPVALNGVNMDIPLPGITVEEFASPDCAEYTSMLQTARHLIELRKLEDKVLHRIHLRDRAETVSLTPSDRRIIAEDLRTEIEDWYSNGCLLKSAGADDIQIHIRISWLAARYYNLLLLLYYPSRSSPTGTAPLLSRGELASLAQKHVQANAVRFRQRQLPLNHVTLCRLFPVCMVFLHCFLASQGTHGGGPPPVDVREEVSICADMMASYPAHWTQAHHAAAVVRQLASLVGTARPFPRAGASWALSESDRAWRLAIKTRLTELTQQVLGKGSTYRLVDDWEDAVGAAGVGQHMAGASLHFDPQPAPGQGAGPMGLGGMSFEGPHELDLSLRESEVAAGAFSIMDFL